MQENAKPKTPMVRMSAEDWRKTHQDFKAQIKGQRYVLKMTRAGTTLVPVEIVKEVKK